MSIRELLYYLAILRKRWWLITLLMISTVGTVVVISNSQNSLYEASLKFLLTTPPISEMSVYNEFRQVSVGDMIPSAQANFMSMLTSKVVIWDAIEILGADTTADEVLAQLTVEELPNSGFVELSLRCEDPQLAADMTNTLMEVALRYYGELRAKPTTMGRIFISEQLKLSREAWEKAEEKLSQFQTDNKIGDLDTEVYRQQNLIEALTLQHDTASAEGNMQAVARYESILAQREQELQNLRSLRSQYTALETTTSQTRGIYGLLLDRQTQAELKENEIMSVGFISVLGPARKPSKPTSLLPKLVLIAGVVSLVMGVFLSFAWEYLETQKALETMENQAATDKHKPQKNLP